MGGWGRGSDDEVSICARASMARKSAPRPMGPKWPQNKASLYVLISGIQRFRAKTMGIRRHKMMRQSKATSLPGVKFSVSGVGENRAQGMMAPK